MDSVEETKNLKELKDTIGWESDNTDELSERLAKVDKQMLIDSAVYAVMCVRGSN